MQKWKLCTKHIELDPGQRAYLYQQLTEFEPFLLQDSTVDVDIDKQATGNLNSGEPEAIKVTITLTAEGANVSASAEGSNLYTAAKSAQNQLLDFLHGVQNEVLTVEDAG